MHWEDFMQYCTMTVWHTHLMNSYIENGENVTLD